MRITPEQAADGPLSFARAMRLDRFHKAVLIIVNAETAPDLSLDRREEVPAVTQTLLEVLEDLFHLQMSFFFHTQRFRALLHEGRKVSQQYLHGIRA